MTLSGALRARFPIRELLLGASKNRGHVEPGGLEHLLKEALLVTGPLRQNRSKLEAGLLELGLSVRGHHADPRGGVENCTYRCSEPTSAYAK